MKFFFKTCFIAACLLTPTFLAGESVCRSTADVERFFEANRIGQVPIALTGTVIRAISGGSLLVIGDDFGQLQVHDKDWRQPKPVPGDLVAISGNANITDEKEPYVESIRTVRLAGGQPPPVEILPIRELNAGHHLKDVCTEGLVVDAFSDELDPNYTFLILKDGPDELPIAVMNSLLPNAGGLLDAEVRVTGVFRRTSSGERKFAGPFICVENTDGLSISKPPPSNPFDVPELEDRLYLAPADVARLGKRSATGEVLAVWNGNRFILRANDRRILNITLAGGQEAPPCGSAVEVAGYPETDSFRMNLGKAIFRKISTAPALADKPEDCDPMSLFYDENGKERIQPNSHGQLIRVKGVVRTLPSAANRDRRMLLACGSVNIPVDPGSEQNPFEGLQTGCTAEVTGRCIHEVDSWQPGQIFPRISGLILVIRSSEDIRILANPPWWTPKHLAYVIAGLLAVLLGFAVWNRILKRLVEHRGRELFRAEIAQATAALRVDERTRLAVELHDTLSQNLTGIALAVNAGEYELAKKSLKSCREELKNCLWDLRNNSLEETDINEAIRKTLAPHVGNTKVTIRFDMSRKRLTDKTTHAILHMLRELAVNAVRHGNAGEIRIAGSIEANRVLFSIRDNGCGFDPAQAPGIEEGHFGLQGIRERVEHMGGELIIESRPGNGTKVTVCLKSKS